MLMRVSARKFAASTLALLSSPPPPSLAAAAAFAANFEKNSSTISSNCDSRRRTTRLLDAATVASSLLEESQTPHPQMSVHHFSADQAVASTQDEARRLLKQRGERQQQCTANSRTNESNGQDDDEKRKTPQQQQPFVVVTAETQTAGRGTKGRTWEGGDNKGNLFLTVCIPAEQIPVALTLLPLQTGVIVAKKVDKFIESIANATAAAIPARAESDGDPRSDDCSHNVQKRIIPKTTVKWPNDVLVNDRKIAGILIESETVGATWDTWLLVGIGVNVVHAPDLQASPGKHVRKSTSIQEHCHHSHNDQESKLPDNTASLLGISISNALINWVLENNNNNDGKNDRLSRERKIIADWKSMAQFGNVYELRSDDVEQESSNKQFQGEKVVVLDIQDDGQLLVRGENGKKRLLVAEYMF